MRIDKSLHTLLIFLAALVIITTAYFVERIAAENSASSEYYSEIGLTGARLSDEIYATVDEVSRWKRESGFITQYEFVIYNNSEANITNWTISMPVPAHTYVDSNWNVTAGISGGTINISPDSSILSISSKDSVSFGFILETDAEFYPSELSLSGYRAVAPSGTVFRKIIYLGFAAWAVLLIGFLVTRFNLRSYRERQRNDVRIILQSMNTFISFIDAKDPYTRGHSRRVAMYAAEIAKRMHLSEDEVRNVYYAGLLHDAGKISVPDAVLNKPGTLTEEERELIQQHTVAGGKMLKQMSSLRGIRETALYHHERFDGQGYPDGLKGESIPLYARIVGVADSYDAMSSNRVYRRHLNKDEIIEEIQKGSGTQFDPEIVPYMVDMINDGYVNVVKMETAENDDDESFFLGEEDIPGVYI